MNKVYIIIVTYNGMKWLSRCLESCKNNQVIVVDNNSTDSTVNFINSNYPSIIVIKQQKNIGFGQANNIGIKYAIDKGADYLFLMNQDVYLYYNTIEDLLKVSKSNKEYGVLSPIHLNTSGKYLDYKFSLFIAPKKNKYLLNDALNKKLKQVYDFPFINAAAWLIPVRTINKIGGFDPLFFHYGEDDNYCQRILYHGLKIGVVTNSKIIHDRDQLEKRKPLKFSPDYYRNYCNMLKVKYGNINNVLSKRIVSKEKHKQLLNIVKGSIQLRFLNSYGFIKQYILINSVFKQIYISREKNKIKGNSHM